MYGRDYDGKTLRFEASGGLLHSGLVMADKETDSFWSIMTGDALAGPLEGTPLRELPLGVKVRWKEWVAEHPDTLVLSVDGQEHEEHNPYDNYFASQSAPRGATASDDRLDPKTPVYTFRRDGEAYAVPYRAFEEGEVFRLGKGEPAEEIFLFRPKGEAIFYSTLAWTGDFEHGAAGQVRHVTTGAVFDAEKERFTGGDGEVPRLHGFDTFWFHWSEVHPKTAVLH